jgi:hypothetical protein
MIAVSEVVSKVHFHRRLSSLRAKQSGLTTDDYSGLLRTNSPRNDGFTAFVIASLFQNLHE